MTTGEAYETAIKAAERELKQTQTADDVRNVWRRHTSALGHRTLGRLLLGRSADELLERRAEREA